MVLEFILFGLKSSSLI